MNRMKEKGGGGTRTGCLAIIRNTRTDPGTWAKQKQDSCQNKGPCLRGGNATVKLWALLPFGNLISGVIFRAVGSGQVYGFSIFSFCFRSIVLLPVMPFISPSRGFGSMAAQAGVPRFWEVIFQLQGPLFT